MFDRVLPQILALAVRYNIRTLSLPLIWDNILLSMWTISGSYVGFGWKEGDAAVSDASHSSLSANRREELAVYECMTHYLDAHLRLLRQCLAALPAHSPLRHIVFYLPASATQNTLLYNLDAHNHLDASDASALGDDLAAAQPLPSPSSSVSAHPFLAKCKQLFQEVFQ